MNQRDINSPKELRTDIDDNINRIEHLEIKNSSLENEIKQLKKALYFLIEENNLDSPF
ncbi:hypothetical protein [Winogradskyella psychrotolerans]|uniref:hypothetical protein n=1 Tax=Winogradskyella psychrotolerans TaxID=1344585 RepID=UPI001C07B2FC|nr:hypothetical protein [Winogradskyella psychrotolerans]MBU2926763.1 hypothetical protein [Winogradskyella psychrotolerans]